MIENWQCIPAFPPPTILCVIVHSYAVNMEYGMLNVGSNIDIQRTDGMYMDKYMQLGDWNLQDWKMTE